MECQQCGDEAKALFKCPPGYKKHKLVCERCYERWVRAGDGNYRSAEKKSADYRGMED